MLYFTGGIGSSFISSAGGFGIFFRACGNFIRSKLPTYPQADPAQPQGEEALPDLPHEMTAIHGDLSTPLLTHELS